MTQPEYEQKKRECWEEYLNTETPQLAAWNKGHAKDAFDSAFDRAYALGREKETIMQGQIEKAAQEHADELRVSHSIPGALVPMLHDIAKSSYLQGAQDLIGKQEKDAEDTVISGWVARASDGHLALFKRKPDREIYMRSNNGLWFGGSMTELDSTSFPDLMWEDEPEQVEIIIKRKKK